MKHLLTIGIVFVLLSACSDQKAIELVQESKCDDWNMWAALFETQLEELTWQDCLERSITLQGGIIEDWEWAATSAFDNRREKEWFVSFTDPSGKGLFFIADLRNNKVILVNADLITADRIGFLTEEESPTVNIELLYADWKSDSEGSYFEIKGTAINSREPIVSVSAEVDIAVRIGDQVLNGEFWWDSDPDPFRFTSPDDPWPVGQSRTFCYRSARIPAVYSDSSVEGQAVAVFQITTETVSRSTLTEHIHVDRSDWPAN